MNEVKIQTTPNGLPIGAIDYSPITDEEILRDSSTERTLAENKKKAYELRFGFSYNEGNNFLPISLYRRELRNAEEILSKKYGATESRVVGHEDQVYGFEITTAGRKFAIPMDGFYRSAGRVYEVFASGKVVSVLEESLWPAWIRAAMIGGSGMKISEDAIDLSPKITNTLRNISEGDTTSDLRDMAMVYGLGDRSDEIPTGSHLRAMVLEKSRESFELSDDQIKKLLESIGVRIIDVGARVSVDPNAPENDKTEIDALISAIEIADEMGQLFK